MCSCSIYSARYWPISTFSWEDLRKKSLVSPPASLYICLYPFSDSLTPINWFLFGLSVSRHCGSHPSGGHQHFISRGYNSRSGAGNTCLWITKGQKMSVYFGLGEIFSDFMDRDVQSPSWCHKCCYRQKSSLFFNRHRFDSWTDTALQNRECFAINLAVSIKSFVWKLSCKKHRSLPLDKGHYQRRGLCVWKDEDLVFKRPVTGVIKRKPLSYKAYLGEKLMLSFITKALIAFSEKNPPLCT